MTPLDEADGGKIRTEAVGSPGFARENGRFVPRLTLSIICNPRVLVN